MKCSDILNNSPKMEKGKILKAINEILETHIFGGESKEKRISKILKVFEEKEIEELKDICFDSEQKVSFQQIWKYIKEKILGIKGKIA